MKWVEGLHLLLVCIDIRIYGFYSYIREETTLSKRMNYDVGQPVKIYYVFDLSRMLKQHGLFHFALTAVSGVGSSPALATCEMSQVLLAGVSGGFSRGSPVFAPPTD